MRMIHFTKMHGLGNDFVVMNNIDGDISLSVDEIRKLSDRRFGIGFDQLASKWLQIKLILVFILTIYHVFLGACLKKFSIDKNTHSSKFYRIFNEVPTILLILIVFIVIFKPI